MTRNTASRPKIHFNPRSPSGLRLTPPLNAKLSVLFQSTQPKRAATHYILSGRDSSPISIHAARVGCDFSSINSSLSWGNFNPRSPSGLRPKIFRTLQTRIRFQSTQPEWAATVSYGFCFVLPWYFNPRSPSGLRLPADYLLHPNFYFNPRSPSGLRPNYQQNYHLNKRISIHAARVGCDYKPFIAVCKHDYFNPRSPRGLRRYACLSVGRGYADFNPRSPRGLRRKTEKRDNNAYHFNPRSPRGLRLTRIYR